MKKTFKGIPQFDEYGIILKQTEELVFDYIGFPTDFPFTPRSVSMNTATRRIRKIGGTSLSNSQFFNLFEYI